MQCVTGNMASNTLHRRSTCLRFGMRLNGVLVGGLSEEAFELLEEVFRRRYGKKYERVMEEVDSLVEDGRLCLYQLMYIGGEESYNKMASEGSVPGYICSCCCRSIMSEDKQRQVPSGRCKII